MIFNVYGGRIMAISLIIGYGAAFLFDWAFETGAFIGMSLAAIIDAVGRGARREALAIDGAQAAFQPRAGGHVFFIPVWLFAGIMVLVGVMFGF